MNRIYDCFCFFNELDVLEVRLNELNEVVDFFVLVEAEWTHQKKSKPLYYELNKDRFAKFHSKIRHIIVKEEPGFFYNFRRPTPWDFEKFQKDQIKMGLYDCKPDDVVIISDIDEIPNPRKIEENRNLKSYGVFQQRMYYYYLNCLEVEPSNHSLKKWWYGPVMTPFSNFKTGNKLRIQREINKFTNGTVIEDAGWHFSYLGGVERIIHKIESYAHTEYNSEDFKNPAKIKELIESGKSIFGRDTQCIFTEINSEFPVYIQNNKEKFKKFIFEKP
jgi:beta-1,4-mannosyl-glycoprotein beta-1,4-N-acetylglucosaminyltransferase